MSVVCESIPLYFIPPMRSTRRHGHIYLDKEQGHTYAEACKDSENLEQALFVFYEAFGSGEPIRSPRKREKA